MCDWPDNIEACKNFKKVGSVSTTKVLPSEEKTKIREVISKLVKTKTPSKNSVTSYENPASLIVTDQSLTTSAEPKFVTILKSRSNLKKSLSLRKNPRERPNNTKPVKISNDSKM